MLKCDYLLSDGESQAHRYSFLVNWQQQRIASAAVMLENAITYEDLGRWVDHKLRVSLFWSLYI